MGFGNYLVPVQIGAPDMAKNLSWVHVYNLLLSPVVSCFISAINEVVLCFVTYCYLKVVDPTAPTQVDRSAILRAHSLEELAPYLAGLFEADGHFVMPSTPANPNTVRYVRILITFAMHDLPLAQHLSKLLNNAPIRMKTANNACVLTVVRQETVNQLINLLNGNMRTPKHVQLGQAIA